MLSNIPRLNYNAAKIGGATTADEMPEQPWVFDALWRLGRTKTEIGRHLGESPQVMTQWFSAGKVPQKKWPKVASALGKSLDWMRTGRDPTPISLDGTSRLATRAVIRAVGYDPETLDEIWSWIVQTDAEAATLSDEQQAELVLTIYDLNTRDISVEALQRFIYRIKRGKL